MKTNKSDYDLIAKKRLEIQGLINPKHMQTLAVFETRRDKAFRHILEKERMIEERKQLLEQKDIEYEAKIAQKAQAEK